MIIKNAKIVLVNEVIDNGWLEVKGDKIVSVNAGKTKQPGIDVKGNILMPGFIDVHMHGGYGVSFETGTTAGFDLVAKEIVKEGVTRFCMGTVTSSIADLEKYFSVYGQYMKANNVGPKARHAGVHMEGPYINKKFKGAHELKLIHDPSVKEMERLIKIAGEGNIAYVTYAPELQDGSFTSLLLEHKINPSMGHSAATFKEIEQEVSRGAKHYTHLHNGMSLYHHRTPGMVNAGLYFDDIMTELITDGVHNDLDVIRQTFKIKTADHMVIITDCVPSKGLPDGDYRLGNLPVVKKGMQVRLQDGTLAGSGATYDFNVRTFYKAVHPTLIDLAKVTSGNQARELRIDHKTGTIQPNKLADLVCLSNDDELNVLLTVVEGEIVYNKFQ